jgi:hypothetical protein
MSMCPYCHAEYHGTGPHCHVRPPLLVDEAGKPVVGVHYVKTQDTREFVLETIPLLLESGWTCLDLDAYKTDADNETWNKNIRRPLWVSPSGVNTVPIDRARTIWNILEFDRLLETN